MFLFCFSFLPLQCLIAVWGSLFHTLFLSFSLSLYLALFVVLLLCCYCCGCFFVFLSCFLFDCSLPFTLSIWIDSLFFDSSKINVTLFSVVYALTHTHTHTLTHTFTHTHTHTHTFTPHCLLFFFFFAFSVCLPLLVALCRR